LALASSAWSAPDKEYVINASVQACKNFATGQVEWTVTWDGNAKADDIFIQALAEAEFGDAFIDFTVSPDLQSKSGKVSGAFSNEQPWAATLDGVYIVNGAIDGHAGHDSRLGTARTVFETTEIPNC